MSIQFITEVASETHAELDVAHIAELFIFILHILIRTSLTDTDTRMSDALNCIRGTELYVLCVAYTQYAVRSQQPAERSFYHLQHTAVTGLCTIGFLPVLKNATV